VYVVDNNNHRVQVFTLAGAFVRKWGTRGSGDGELDQPSGICIDGGVAFVTDVGNHRVVAFAASTGRFIRTWGEEGVGDGQLETPTGVGVAGDQVFVVDTGNRRVVVFRR
jgi:tripartite motif-containing protein 71